MADYTNPKAQNAIFTDLQEIVTLSQANAKMDPSTQDNIPNGAKRLVAVSGGYQLQTYNGETWSTVGKLVHDADKLDSYDANTGTAANSVPVRNATGALPGDITGNAATTTKLETARTIDLGGIVSADATAFDGTANITIPVNSVTINNENDDAVNGTLSIAHGGTGRTDGAASDVVVSSASGSVRASDYGQIGDAKSLASDADLNSIVVSGNYTSTSGTTDLHYPYTGTNTWYLLVKRNSTLVKQVLFDTSGFWVRESTDTGASWSGWVSNGAPATSGLKIYVSKSGSDNNTGLDNAYPVLTIDRALAIARGYSGAGNNNTAISLYIGEGDWGNITLYNFGVPIYIYAYDGAASEYTSSLPVFTSILVNGGYVCLYGVVAQKIVGNNNSYIYVNGYNRFANVIAQRKSNISVSGTVDIMSMDSHESVFRSYADSMLYFASVTITIAESLNLTKGFLYINQGGTQVGLPWNSCTITVPDTVSVTGAKYYITDADTICTKAHLDSLPGTTAGTISVGSRISTGIWGGGGNTYLAGDGTFHSTVNCTSGTYYDTIQIGYTSISDSDSVKRNVYPFYDIKKGDQYGHGLMICSDAALVLSGGEGGRTIVQNGAATGSSENIFLASDNNVYIYLGQNSAYNANQRVTFTAGTTYIPSGLHIRNRSITKGTLPSSTNYVPIALGTGDAEDGAVNKRVGLLETCVSTAGLVSTYINAYKFQSGSTTYAQIGVKYPLSGSATGFAPTPPATSNTNDIATTAWVRSNAVPVGTICMFSGSFGGTGNRFPIPLGSTTPNTNWCICDGVKTNGLAVPDLRNRFIVGSGSTYKTGNTGGATSQTVTVSGSVGSTTLSVSQMPSHTHTYIKARYVDGYGGGAAHNGSAWGGNNSSDSGVSTSSSSTGGSSSHTHSFSASKAVSTLPPYYALAFIIMIKASA